MNCVQTNLFTPYLCHVNLLSLIMFKTNQPKETMKKETINIKSETGNIFVQYLRTYRHLNSEGKKMAEDQMFQLGKNYDFMSNLLSTTTKK